MTALALLLGGVRAGTLIQDPVGRLHLEYAPEWQDRPDAFPLSVSMPLTRTRHGEPEVRAFLDGLLPDNAAVRDAWGRRFQVSARNPFALLGRMGEDCAGAVQIVPESRLAAITPPSGGVEWLEESDVEALIKELVQRDGVVSRRGRGGHFSLAGAQPKTALQFDGTRWGIPWGAEPTTHILKPPVHREFHGFEVNEHFCLNLARELGIPAAHSRVERFGQVRVIVVERYDRGRRADGSLFRLHQEDGCQALGIPPTTKYENEGGPGLTDLIALLLKVSDRPDIDVGTLLDAAVFNWALLGTDAHGKNYSVLIAPGGSVRLAPLYDLMSALPYPEEIPPRRAKLSMRVGREYHARDIRRRDWVRLAESAGLDVDPVLDRARSLLQQIPAAIDRTAAEMAAEGLGHRVIEEIAGHFPARTDQLLSFLDVDDRPHGTGR